MQQPLGRTKPKGTGEAKPDYKQNKFRLINQQKGG